MKKWKVIMISILILGLSACSTNNSEKSNNRLEINELVEVVSPLYDVAYPYSEGFAVVGQRQNTQMKYNYIDLKGNLLLDKWVDFADSFSEGMAVVGTLSSLPDQYKSRIFVEGVYLFGYIDTQGEIVIEQQYLGTSRFRPRPFYKGYAEVNWIDLNKLQIETLVNSTWNNVIDKKGKKQFEFDGLTNVGPVDVTRDFRVLQAIWNWNLDDYAKYNPWMQAHVQNEEFNSLIFNDSEGEKTYLVNQDKEVLKELDGYAFWLDESQDYIRLSSPESENENFPNVSLLDNNGFVIIDSASSYEVGLNDYFIVGEIQGDRMTYRIMNTEQEYLTDEEYSFVYPTDNHYIVMTKDRYFFLLDENGKVTADFGNQINFVSPLSVYIDESGRNALSAVEVNVIDEKGYSTNYLYDLNGNLLVGSKGSYQALYSDLIGNYDDGNYKLLNLKGEIIKELPYPGYGVIQRYTENGLDLILYDFDAQMRYYFEIIKDNEEWQIKELANGQLGDSVWNGTVENTIARNDESKINSEHAWHGYVELLDYEGNQLVPMGTKRAVSLVENGIYITANEAEEKVSNSGQVIADAKGMQLHSENFTSEVYDELGTFSENRIAFKKDEKWGYLEAK